MPEDKRVFYCLPHSHWEGAVFKTREQYLAMGLPHILHALKLLQEYPEYRYTIDQACYVQPFLERYPEAAAVFRQRVAEGRLALVGGTDVMLDVNMPGGESFVRQVLYGKGFFRRELGVEITTGWQLDTFGHHAQMPQLLRQAGFETFWFFRGVASWEVPAEFLWEGLDGTRITAFSLPATYCNLYGSPQTLPEFTAWMTERYTSQEPWEPGPERMGIAAWDVGDPEEHLPALAAEFNRQAERPFRLQFAVPADFEAVVARRTDLAVVGGELNPIFQGTYSSRVELKQRTRELEGLLTTAEKLGAILRWQGVETDENELWRAWEPMLFNQAHDLMSGVMTDGVYEDTLRGYEFSRQIAEEEVRARVGRLVELVDTAHPTPFPLPCGAGEGGPETTPTQGVAVVVFNALGWERTEVAEVTVGFSEGGVRGVRLVAPDGEEVPAQILEAQRYDNGDLLTARVAFLAKGIPALGYAVYRLLPSTEAASEATGGEEGVLENELYRVRLDAASGAILGLTVKADGWEALRAPGNVVALEEDHGDFWELYRPLDGASRIAMTERHEPPGPGQAIFSTEQTEGPGTITRGPVLEEFTVTHPYGQGRITTSVRVCAGVPRIELRTTILNQDTRVRYRVLFPTSLAEGRSVHEIPFGAQARPEGIEFPAQNWADYGSGERGLMLLNRGLPGNNVAGGTMMLSLLRSTSIVAYSSQGGFEQESSDTGLELGQELTLEYALVPRQVGRTEARPWREGQAFNQPLLARTAAVHEGPLPARGGFLEVTHPNVVLSALKVSEDGTGAVLRVYEAAGEPAEAEIVLPAGAASVNEADLIETPGEALEVVDGKVRLSLKPFEIKTLRLAFPRR